MNEYCNPFKAMRHGLMTGLLVCVILLVVSCLTKEEVKPPAPTTPPVSVMPAYDGKVVLVGKDVQTIDEAFAQVKKAGGGAILLEYGKTYQLGATMNPRGMKSLAIDAYGVRVSAESMVFSPVVKTGGKPLINKDGNPGFQKFVMKNVTVDNEGKPGLCIRWIGAGAGDVYDSQFLSCGLVVQDYQGDKPGEWSFAKVSVVGAYSGNDSSHMQGLYASHLPKLTVDDSLFEHNGWSEAAGITGGKATMFNHNMYLSECNNVTITNNKILNASSMGIKFRSDVPGGSKNIVVRNNLFLNGEIGIGIGGNVPGAGRFQNATIEGNELRAIGSKQPTKRALAWGIELDGVEGGSVKNNKFVDWPDFSNSFYVRQMIGTVVAEIDVPLKAFDSKYMVYGPEKKK